MKCLPLLGNRQETAGGTCAFRLVTSSNRSAKPFRANYCGRTQSAGALENWDRECKSYACRCVSSGEKEEQNTVLLQGDERISNLSVSTTYFIECIPAQCSCSSDYANGWTVRCSNLGRGRRFFSPKRQNRLLGPPSLLLHWRRDSFSGVSRSGREISLPIPIQDMPSKRLQDKIPVVSH